ncbi:MAG: lipopolysaccharide heptosyltransferase I [Craterilacuibacter sp.]
MMNVLIVRTSSMGDLIHTWPAITDLLAHYPNLRLSWMAEENFCDIAGLHPGISDVIPIAWRRWRKSLLSKATWFEIGALRTRLRGTAWDCVLDSQGLVKSAIPASWAGGTLAGYDKTSIREPLASLFYDKKITVSRNLSAIERNRQLFARAFGYQSTGAPCFGIGKGQRPDWLLTDDYAVLLHATSRDSKEWPENHWIALGQWLNTLGICSVLPWGNEREHERAKRLAGAISGAIPAPRLRLREAAGLLGHARAVIGVDTGLSHLANAVDVPLVAIYTDTDPALTGVVETPYAHNLGNIGICPSPNEVQSALQAIWSRI